MKAAIASLEITLATLENNEPIHRREGNEEQADAEKLAATDIRRALHVLRAIDAARAIV